MTTLSVPPEVKADCPYKGMDLFTEDEADSIRFFGRSAEQHALITDIRTSRLTVLHAESGVGKSSLLRAGVTARLRGLAREELELDGNPMLVPILFSDWRNRPLDDFRAAVAVQGGPFAVPRVESIDLPEGRMVEVLAAATTTLDCTLLVILDQFEEHLGLARASGCDSRFVQELTECLEDRRLMANFLIGVREDAFGKVDDLFRDHVTGGHTNVQLGYLGPDAAREAIELPVERVYNAGREEDQRVSLEPGLADEVLRQVRHGRDPLGLGRGERDSEDSPLRPGDEIEAPLLQLVMERLWEAEVGGPNPSRRLRLDTFQTELGGATTIIRAWLDNVLKELSADELGIVTDLFRELLTSSGTKLALTVRDLAMDTDHDEDQVAQLAARLHDARILRRVEPATGGDEFRFEIFHDKLTEPILELLNRKKQARLEEDRAQAEAARRQAEEQAKRELENARVAHENAELAHANAMKARRRTKVAIVIALVCVGLFIFAIIETISARDERTHARIAARQARMFGLQAAAFGLQALAQSDEATRPDIALLLLLAEHRAAHRAASSPTSPLGLTAAATARSIAALLQTTRASSTTGILHGHTDAVESVAFDPRQDILASGSADKTIRLWHVTAGTRAPFGPPVHAAGPVFSVAFSPDGRTLAAATFDQVEVWSVSTRRKLAHFNHSGGRLITSVAFSPNGRWLAMGTADGAAIVWQPETRTHWTRQVSASHQVKSVAFSPDGTLLATASGTHVSLWSVADHARVTTLPSPHVVTAVAFSPRPEPDGRTRLAAASGASLRLWSLSSDPSRGPVAQPVSRRGPSQLLYSIAFSPDGHTVAAGGGGMAELIDASTGRLKTTLTGPRGALYGLAFNRDGSILAAGAADRTVHLWGPPFKPLVGLPIASGIGSVSGVAISPDDRSVVAVGWRRKGGFVAFIDTAGRLAGPDPFDRIPTVPARSVAFDPVGHLVAVGTAGGSIQLWNSTTRTMLRQWRASRSGAVFSVAFNRAGTQLASGGADGTVRAWPMGTGGGTGRIVGRDFGPVYAVAWTPDGTIVASGSADHTIRLWNVVTRAQPETIPLDDSAFGLSFSPTGAYMAAAGGDGTVREWRRGPRGYIFWHALIGHGGLARSVAFSPDGATLASSGSDGTIRLWDVAAGAPIPSSFTQSLQWVEGVAFSHDGKFLVSGGLDGTVRLWRAVVVPRSFSTLLRSVCAFLGAGLSRAEWRRWASFIAFQPTCASVTPS
jgi:WD40 repeat protein